MGNNQPSARKKTYYISLAILAGMCKCNVLF